MLDANYLFNNFDEVVKKLKTRNSTIEGLDKFKTIYQARKTNLLSLENLSFEKNKFSKLVAELKKTNNLANSKEYFLKISEIKKTIKDQQVKADQFNKELNEILLNIPNIPADSVPIGNSEEENKEIKTWGNIPKFDFKIKPHYQIGEELDIIDFKRGVKISGTRYHIYKNQGAVLKRALMNFMLENNFDNGYQEVSPPLIVKAETLISTGQLPKFENDLFKLENQSYLIPTAEVPLVGMWRNEIITLQELPINITAYTPCFRSEAGSAGKDTRGIIRLHQFHKVEIVKITTIAEGIKELNNLLFHVEQLLQKLKLPYRVIELCSGDIGFAAQKTFDLEVWLPDQNCYREISSVSLCGEFQSRRMKLRYKDENGKTTYPATLNGSALAIDRTIAAILENYQNQDGSISIPEALQPYMKNIKKIS